MTEATLVGADSYPWGLMMNQILRECEGNLNDIAKVAAETDNEADKKSIY